MTKWADYVITAVKYSADPKHIDSVQARPGDDLDSPITLKRAKVVELIAAGSTFVTAYEKNGTWTKGEDVRVITVEGTKYIRTDTNSTAKDNLGNLPTF